MVQADAPSRRVFAASLAGRLAPISGRFHVLGSPLPSERRRALSHVTLCDIGTLDSLEGDLTVGEVIAERLENVVSWWRPGASGRQIANWIGRITQVLDAHLVRGPSLTADATLTSLTAMQRSSVIVSAALAERAGVIFVDLGDGLPAECDLSVFVDVLSTLAPAATTLVVGMSSFDLDPERVRTREMIPLAISDSERKAVLV